MLTFVTNNYFLYIRHKKKSLMTRVPSIYGNIFSQLLYIFICPTFFFLFSIVYHPFGMLEHLEMGRSLFFVNTALLTAIIFVTLLLTRTGFLFVFRSGGRHLLGFIFWCIGEMVVCAYFMALYIYLAGGAEGNYFEQVAVCLEYSCLILIYPYAMVSFPLALSAACSDMKVREKSGTVRFLDSSKKLRLAVVREAILFIEANENYVEIHYLDDNGVKMYQLRSSMRSIEPLVEKNGLCRCHRSYFVNPSHIKALRRERADKIILELDAPCKSIPVSLKFYSDISEKI